MTRVAIKQARPLCHHLQMFWTALHGANTSCCTPPR